MSNMSLKLKFAVAVTNYFNFFNNFYLSAKMVELCWQRVAIYCTKRSSRLSGKHRTRLACQEQEEFFFSIFGLFRKPQLYPVIFRNTQNEPQV